MKPNSYSFYDVFGYSEGAKSELAKEFQNLGFEHIKGEFGGGIQAEQIIAWLSIHQGSIEANLLSAFIVSILNTAFNWYVRHRKNKRGNIPVIKISIYINNNPVLKTYRIDKHYRAEDIESYKETK
jgi:uncharacterized protein YehS (DUF1456 family)